MAPFTPRTRCLAVRRDASEPRLCRTMAEESGNSDVPRERYLTGCRGFRTWHPVVAPGSERSAEGLLATVTHQRVGLFDRRGPSEHDRGWDKVGTGRVSYSSRGERVSVLLEPLAQIGARARFPVVAIEGPETQLGAALVAAAAADLRTA